MATIFSTIKDMATHPAGAERWWAMRIRPEDKANAAQAMIDWIVTHGGGVKLGFSGDRSNPFLYVRPAGMGLTTEQGVALYDFLFRPANVTRTMRWEL